MAFVIGKGLAAARKLYALVKEQRPRMKTIYTDANSCYQVTFAQLQIPENHEIGKRNTHLMESSHSSIRDHLARFMRKSKRHSKTWDMLELSLKLFFDYKRLEKYHANTK